MGPLSAIPGENPVKRSYRPALIGLAPVTALAVAAAGLTAVGLVTAGEATAQAPSPALKLVAPKTQQTIERGKGEDVFLYDLGLQAIAEQASLEIRTQRGRSYRDPIQATMTLGQGAATPLPSELITNVDKLMKFFAFSVTDKAGKTVKTGQINFCPNSESAARAVPGGAPTSPYPTECGSHPFAKGGVVGIQRGWSTPVLGDYDAPKSFNGKDGVYTVRLLIRAGWRKALGMTAAQSELVVKVKVKTVGETSVVNTSEHAHGGSGEHDMSTSGALSPQHAAMAEARKRALGKANTPADAPPAQPLRAADPPAGPKPDLRSVPAYQIRLDQTNANGNPSKKTYLTFGATVWNAGPSPLVVDGFRRPNGDLMDAYQYFYDAAGNEVGSSPAGTLEWDPREGHNHWHFTAFASYRLLDSTKKLTKRSGKEAFCLAPTDPINLNVTAAQWKPASTDLGTACGEENSVSIREVLDVGWGDTYDQSLPGQSFNVTNLANGTYYIEVLANPDQKLIESNPNNNSALRKVKLGGKVGGKRTIKVYPYAGIKAP
jgi:hypothetical protein